MRFSAPRGAEASSRDSPRSGGTTKHINMAHTAFPAQLLGASMARFDGSLSLSAIVGAARLAVHVHVWTALAHRTDVLAWCAVLLDAAGLGLRFWLHAKKQANRASIWETWLTISPCLNGLLLLLRWFRGNARSFDNATLLLGSSITPMLIATSCMLSTLMNRHHGLSARNRALSGAGHAAVANTCLLAMDPSWTAVSLWPWFASAAAFGLLGEAIGDAIAHAESQAVSVSVALALEPAHAALRLATYHTGELSPTISWSRVQLLDRIGVGAFGTVFAAEYAGSKVAAKLIHNGKAEPGFLIQECKMMLTLRHPNILTTLGLVSDHIGRHAILMELMVSSLSSVLRSDARLSWHNPSTAIALQVARGMAYLQERHIVHGDLKPANVLLGPAPVYHVKLCDFGEARRCEQTPGGSTSAGGLKGDLWAFGGLLIHLERREPPFT
jgi:hypothetical protein